MYGLIAYLSQAAKRISSDPFDSPGQLRPLNNSGKPTESASAIGLMPEPLF